MRILGLDEAGRGSVLGPMVIGAFSCLAADEAALQAAGAADSKTLSAKARERIRERLTPLGVAAAHVIPATAIDAGNLNTIEEEVFALAIIAAAPDVVFIDAPVNPRGIPAFQRRLVARLGDAPVPRFVIEPKADLNYPVVGAASIFAKVARDAAITALSEEQLDAGWGALGSGYPSDPTTRRWLLGFLRRGEPLPVCVRSRWGTIDVLRQELLFGPRG